MVRQAAGVRCRDKTTTSNIPPAPFFTVQASTDLEIAAIQMAYEVTQSLSPSSSKNSGGLPVLSHSQSLQPRSSKPLSMSKSAHSSMVGLAPINTKCVLMYCTRVSMCMSTNEPKSAHSSAACLAPFNTKYVCVCLFF